MRTPNGLHASALNAKDLTGIAHWPVVYAALAEIEKMDDCRVRIDGKVQADRALQVSGR